MAYEWAKPGAKVICIDANPFSHLHRCRIPAAQELDGLTKGAAYTIREVTTHPYAEGICLYLTEIIRPRRSMDFCEAPFAIERFRPLITQADDVEMFLRLASPSPLERLDLLAERMNEIYGV